MNSKERLMNMDMLSCQIRYALTSEEFDGVFANNKGKKTT